METITIAIGYVSLFIQYVVYMFCPILFLWFLYEQIVKPFISLFRKGQKS